MLSKQVSTLLNVLRGGRLGSLLFIIGASGMVIIWVKSWVNGVKDMAQKSLGDCFMKLEVAKTSVRVTVAEGTEEESMKIIESEIMKAIEMAMSFMSQMNPDNK